MDIYGICIYIYTLVGGLEHDWIMGYIYIMCDIKAVAVYVIHCNTVYRYTYIYICIYSDGIS